MTHEESVSKLLERFRVRAKVVNVDYDPAGDTTEYIPDPEDVKICMAATGRKLSDSDFLFCVGCGPTPTHYLLNRSIL